MNALFRAALVGTAIGLLEVLIYLYGPEDDFTGANTMLLAPFPVGLTLGWLIRLPRWRQVAILAPFVNIAIITLALHNLTFTDIMDLGMLPGSLIFAAIGASGHATAAAMLVPGSRTLRSSVIGAVVIGFAGVSLGQDAIAEVARTRRLAHSGIPLMELGAQEYRPTHLTEWFGEFEDGPPSVELSYERLRDRSEIELYLMPGTAASPQAACTEPVPDVTYRADIPGACRQASTDVWAHTETTYTTA
ncbi:hypothetical protein [Streptosporangium carneum]|uniref:Uncharacterized protein n=1 Tax=Streptosporangium carneum TaxID=47481 RepID=A0A9W6I2Z3_9ACTN|nr:hypothetical protein [Streptosporangium carneum]GLK10732.1 hypothetical protein GCM10017600_41380 [Streptosporangium carneum]